jgi:CubicO group peptidase (beta-lactamase class C family)
MKPDAMPAIVAVDGFATAAFSQIADVFARGVARQESGGAAFCVYQNGVKVVDLVGGAFERETVVQVLSVSKAIVAVAAAHAAEAGRLDLDEPIAVHWPAFARTSTARITTRMVLAHSSGIPVVAEKLTIDELLAGELDRAVERQEPLWGPGTAHGYAAFTFGALMDGVFRSALDTSVADYTARYLTDRLEAAFWFGVSDAVRSRTIPLEFRNPALTPAEALAQRDGTAVPDGSFAAILPDPAGFFGDRRVAAAGWPALSGVGSASGLARIIAATIGEVDGIRLLTEESLTNMVEVRSAGLDRCLHKHNRFGSGVELPHTHLPLLGPGSYGHQGAAGSLVAAHPGRGLAIAYTTNVSSPVLGAADQALALCAAIRQMDDVR